MLKAFCAAANLKALLQGPRCPDALKIAVPLLEKKWDQDRWTGTIGEVNNIGNASSRTVAPGQKSKLMSNQSEAAFRAGFNAMSKELGEWAQDQPIEVHKQIIIKGVEFTCRNASPRDAEVFFQPMESGQLIPGAIEKIMSIEDESDKIFILLIRRRKEWRPEAKVGNPFSRYPDFGAELWSSEFEDYVDHVPSAGLLYHSQSRPWSDNVVVLKPIKPVSDFCGYVSIAY